MTNISSKPFNQNFHIFQYQFSVLFFSNGTSTFFCHSINRGKNKFSIVFICFGTQINGGRTSFTLGMRLSLFTPVVGFLLPSLFSFTSQTENTFININNICHWFLKHKSNAPFDNFRDMIGPIRTGNADEITQPFMYSTF